MTGRKWEHQIYPLSFSEMANFHTAKTEKSLLEKRLLYGCYPDVVLNSENAEEIVRGLANSNMYKDVLKWANISKSHKIVNLTKALAYQVGSQVSTREIGQLIDLDHKTVEKYINLLEQAYIIFKVESFSRNLRNELKASNKYYFYDVGIRNAIIGDFRAVDKRDDIGGLFENFIISELVKKNNEIGNFWRTKSQAELDYIVSRNGQLEVYEIKWNPKARVTIPKQFVSAYTPNIIEVINRDNYDEFLVT
jgi:predicted AAA+ superfamily ATPase